MNIRESLNRSCKLDVYDFLINESEEIDKSHRLFMENGFKKYFPELYQLLINDERLYKFNTFRQKMWHFFHEDYDIHYCPVCGKELGLKNIKEGYRMYCSNVCKYNDVNYLQKTSEIMSERWKNSDREKICKNIGSGRKKAWDKLSKDEKRYVTQHMRDRLVESNLLRSDDERKEIREKIVKSWKKTYQNKSKEQHEIENKKRIESYRRTLNNRTEEDIKRVSENVSNGLKNMSVEKKKQKEINKHNSFVKRIQKVRPDVIDVETIGTYGRTIYTCKCTNPDCNKCNNKQYKISYVSYRYRESVGIEKCPICHPRMIGISGGEKEMLEYIRKIYKNKIQENSRNELMGFEIDVYLPDLKLGFEFQGDLWHANPMLFDENFIHPINGKTFAEIHEHDDKKKKIANEQGIEIVEIWESDWFDNNRKTKKLIKEIIKKKIQKFI